MQGTTTPTRIGLKAHKTGSLIHNNWDQNCQQQEWATAMRRRALPALATAEASYVPSPQMAALFMGGGDDDDDGTCVGV
jgi:hypothetical protein